MKISSLAICIFALLITGCSNKNNGAYELFDANTQTQKLTSPENYQKDVDFEWKITKGDRVEITVFNQSSVGGQQLSIAQAGQFTNRDGYEGFLIGKEGTVLLPLVGKIKISQLTEEEASEKLLQEYKKYLKSPFVNVKIRNKKLFVLGEVKEPGVVQVPNGTMSLFEAIAHAKDLTDTANRTNIKIIRGGLKNPTIREIDLTDLNAIKATSLILVPNDIVYVGPRSMKAFNIAIQEQMPLFQLISTILTPWVLLDRR